MNRAKQSINPERLQQLKTAFNLFDINGDGRITFKELKRTMHKIGEKKTDKELHMV